MKLLLKYFLRGLLIIAPVALTIYLVLAILNWLDSIFDIGMPVPGLGILLMVVLLTLLGFVGSSILVRPMLKITERVFHRVPVVSIIYSSIKDLFDAFVGENQRFNQPVMARVSQNPEVLRMGFITNDRLSTLQLPDHVAVYFPFSYDFSGEMLILPREHIRLLQIPSTVAMKFIVSGGVSRV